VNHTAFLIAGVLLILVGMFILLRANVTRVAGTYRARRDVAVVALAAGSFCLLVASNIAEKALTDLMVLALLYAGILLVQYAMGYAPTDATWSPLRQLQPSGPRRSARLQLAGPCVGLVVLAGVFVVAHMT